MKPTTNPILTEQQLDEIKKFYIETGASSKIIAEKFGITTHKATILAGDALEEYQKK